MISRRTPFASTSRLSLGLLLCLSLSSPMVSAQNTATKEAVATPWENLRFEQQVGLLTLREYWPQMTPSQQQQWLGVVAQIPNSNPEQQAVIQARMAEWVKLRAQDRQTIRRNYEKLTKESSSEERESYWKLYQTLQPVHKKSLLPTPLPSSATPERSPN